jgi:hypothetical protein
MSLAGYRRMCSTVPGGVSLRGWVAVAVAVVLAVATVAVAVAVAEWHGVMLSG